MNPSDDDGTFADPVADALVRGAELLRQITTAEQLDDAISEEAERTLRQIADQGAYAWSAQQREDLDTVARNLGRALSRAGRPIDPDAARLRPFEGRNPSFTPMSVDELVAAVRKGERIVGRRLVAPDAGTPLPDKDLAGAQIVDCAFIGFSFDGVDLSGSQLVHTVFQKCSFDRTDLTDASATTCMFDGTSDSGRSSFGRAEAQRT